MATASSPAIIKTYTKDDGTKDRVACRVTVDYDYDSNGKPTKFETWLQNDLVAIDAGITGGGTAATWTTGAKLSESNAWERLYRDSSDTTLGWVTPDNMFEDLTNNSSNFSSQVNRAAATCVAKQYNSKGYGKDFGLSTLAGAMGSLQGSQGTSQSSISNAPYSADAGVSNKPSTQGIDSAAGTRKNYPKNLYYPIALRNNRGQDRLKIDVYDTIQGTRQMKNSFQMESGKKKKIVGTCTLPIPGGVGDANSVSWGPDTMDPASMAIANAVFQGSQDENPLKALGKSVEDAAKDASGDKGAMKQAIAAIVTKQATGVGNILTRKTGAIVNPNMELLFNSPQLRPFAFTYKLSPRSREESNMVKRIIRMFKQSMAVQRTKANLFLKSPNTYKLSWLTGFGSKEHEYLPKIKEVALGGFNVNYTPDGNYATYEDTSMVSYEIQFNFQELEPIYNDDYGNAGNGYDQNIGY
mgnify:FL=1